MPSRRIAQRIPPLDPIPDNLPAMSLPPPPRLRSIRPSVLLNLSILRGVVRDGVGIVGVVIVRPGVGMRIREGVSRFETVFHGGLATEGAGSMVCRVQFVLLDDCCGIGCCIVDIVRDGLLLLLLLLGFGQGNLILTLAGSFILSHCEYWM